MQSPENQRQCGCPKKTCYHVSYPFGVFFVGLVVLVSVFHAICMQSPENVSDAKRISGSAAVQKNVLSRVVSVWRFFVGLVVFWLAFSMQFACSLQKMFRMLRESAAVRLSKKTCYHVSYPFGVFSWVWWCFG